MPSSAETLVSKLSALKSISTSKCHLQIDVVGDSVEIKPVIDGKVCSGFIASYSLADGSSVDIPSHRLHLEYRTIYSSKFNKIVAYHTACTIHSQIKDKNTDLGKAVARLCHKLHDWAIDDEDKDEYLGQTEETVKAVTIAAWVLYHLKLPYSKKGIYIEKGKYYADARAIAKQDIPYYVGVSHWSLGYRLSIKEWYKDSDGHKTIFDDDPVLEVDEHLLDEEVLDSVSWMTDPEGVKAETKLKKIRNEYDFAYYRAKLGGKLKFFKEELKSVFTRLYSDEMCSEMMASDTNVKLKADIVEYMQGTKSVVSDRLKATEAMLEKFGLGSSRSKKAGD